PLSSGSVTPLPNAAGWHKSDVVVSLTAVDPPGGTGIKSVTYHASGAQPLPPTTVVGALAQVPITAEGQTTISYTATDNAFNTSAPQTFTVKLDKTKPIVTAPAAKFVAVTRLPATTIPVTVFAWSGSDALSGLNHYFLQSSTDGAAVQNLSLPNPLAGAD